MKRPQRFGAWTLALLLILSAAGCGGFASSMTQGKANGGYATEDYGYDLYASDAANEGQKSAVAASYDAETSARSPKRIYTADMSLETTDFETAARGLAQAVEDCGGYLSRSSVNSQGDGCRCGDYTARIPSGQFQNFLDTVGGLCHVTWRNSQCDDVSEAYYDVQGRLKTQQTKLARLQELLARAESMEDILTLESAISGTEEAIEVLSGQLQYYDGQVEYATVNLSLREVYRLSNTEEPAGSFGARLGTALSSGWQGFLGGLQDIALALAYSWVWVLLLAALAAGGIRLFQRLRARHPATLPKLRKKLGAEDPRDTGSKEG